MIYAYLRASTSDQDATRAHEAISEFCTSYCQCVDQWVIENASGTTLERPELNEMLDSPPEKIMKTGEDGKLKG